MNDSTFIIQVQHGGLGDHLFFSHLPRIAKKFAGFKYVYISNKSSFRSEQIKELVWRMNPYVDGFCDDEGALLGHLKVEEKLNVLDQIMLFYRMDDGLRFHEPEIYYKPRLLEHLQNAVVFDPNYISNVGMLSKSKLRDYIKAIGGIDCIMSKREKTVDPIECAQVLQAKDIFEYCDIIFSSKKFLCLTSGGATLAAALKVPAVVFFGFGQNKIHRHSPLHSYIDLTFMGGFLVWHLSRINRALKKLFKFH